MRTIERVNWPELSSRSALLAKAPAALRRQSRLLVVEKGQQLFSRGDKPRAMFFVLAGEIRLIRRSRAGGEIVLQRSRAGFIAEASLGQSSYHCDGVVPVTTEVLSIPHDAFSRALDEPAFRDEWLSHLCHELRRQRALSERLSLRSAADRILHFIETETVDGRLTLNQSKRDWASELGLTHEAVYRGLAELSRKGLISVHGRAMWLCGTTS